MRTLTQSFKPAFSLSSFTFIKRFFSPLHFLPLGWCHLYIWSYWYISRQSWFQLVIQKTKIMGSGPITSWQIDGEKRNSDRLHFLGLQNHCRWWLQPWNCKTFASWKKSYDKSRQHIKEQRHHFADKGQYSQSCGFSSSHVWMQELDHKEGWAPKSWCLWIVLEKTLENPLDCKIKPVNLKGNQSQMFIGRTDAEAETPKLWPPFGHVKSRLIGKDPDAGKYWRQEEKGMTEDEMAAWHHWLNGHEFEQTLEMVKDKEVWHAADHEVAELDMTSNWTTTKQHNLKAPCSSQLSSQ